MYLRLARSIDLPAVTEGFVPVRAETQRKAVEMELFDVACDVLDDVVKRIIVRKVGGKTVEYGNVVVAVSQTLENVLLVAV